MPIEEGLFWTRDGERLFYRFQAGFPDSPLLLLLHGHGEHSGRYLKFFNRLADLHFSMAVFDQRGCGRSSGTPVYVSRLEDYLDDVSSFLDFLKHRHPGFSSLYLFGHSLGGLVATAWADRRGEGISKLILSSPLFGLPMKRLMKWFVELLNRWVPQGVIHNPVRPFYLTHDPEEMRLYQQDSLIQRRITVRLVHEMLRYISFFEQKSVSFLFPVYILMAAEDFVVDPEATRRFFERLQAPHKVLKSFPGFFHEIFDEKGQDEVFKELRKCLTDH